MSKRVLYLTILLIVSIGVCPVGAHWNSIERLLFPEALASRQQEAQIPVEKINIRGNRRIPESTIRIWISTREGEPYSPEQIDRDVRALYAQGHFQDVKVYTEDGVRGGKIVTFDLTEWPLILDIKYDGLKSVQQSKLLDEYRTRQIGLSKESQYDPVKAHRAAQVIKDLLADEGHPDAKVDIQKEDLSKTAIALTFKVDEGPRVRVADIEFTGNKVFSSSYLRAHMKYVKQVGVFTTFSSKDIYNKDKLKTDLDRLRVLVYADHGYLRASFGEPKVEDAGHVGTWVPIFGHKGQGIKVTIPVNEGRQYTTGKVTIEDNTEFTADQIKAVLGIKPGEIVHGPDINKGMDNLKKLYGSRGYIEFNPDLFIDWHDSPTDATKGVADLNFKMDEGKQYTLHRLEFIGNTFTRDNVLRREVLLNEGDRYNQQLWDLSILRLNQLGYFDQIKKEDATINTNDREGLVDVTLKVQEKGRQQISFTGGVSGIGGSFVGINYSTNNLLGYGETFSLGISGGNRQKAFSIGFSEPYFRGRPISVGVSLFYQDLQFLGSGFGTVTDPTILSAFNSSDLFTQKTAGITFSLGAPLSYFAKRFRMGRFVRLGLSYSLSTTDVKDPTTNPLNSTNSTTSSTAALLAFVPVTFHQNGVVQSTLTPSITYNTLNNSLDPTSGKSISVGFQLSGGILGGKVNMFEPTVEFKSFRPLFAGKEVTRGELDPKKTRTLGFRVFFGHIGVFGNTFQSNSLSFVGGVPLFSRFYLGGEQDIRGYDIRSISPLVPITETFTTRNVYATDLLGARLKVRPPRLGTPHSVAPDVLDKYTNVNQPIPLQPGQVFPQFPLGADTELLFNAEYRIPIIGPVQLVPFFDIGSAFNLNSLSSDFITSNFAPATSPIATVILNPRGEIATQREINHARTPETPSGGLPPGFRAVFIRGDEQTQEQILLSEAKGGLFQNYRFSVGTELRVQVPVVNVPFRLIFAWNPNAKVNNPFVFEQRRVIRFSVGRTF